MERLLKDAEKLSGQHFEMGNFADIVDAIHVVQDSMGIAGSSAEEAKTTIEGSVNAAKAAWANWLTEFSKDNGDIQARTQELMDTVFGSEGNPGLIGNVVPRVIQIGQTIAESMPSIVSRVGDAIGESLVPMLDEVTGGAATKVWEAASEVGSKVMGVLEDLRPHIEGLIENLGPVLTDVILPALGSAFEVVGDVIKVVGDVIGVVVDVIAGFLAVVNSVVQAIKDASAAAAEFAASNGGNAAQAGSYNTATAYVPSGNVPHMASGGVVSGPTVALIGEAGYNEYVVPNTKSGMRPLAEGVSENLSEAIASLREDIGNMRIYLDGNVLVGGISSRMDRALVM